MRKKNQKSQKKIFFNKKTKKMENFKLEDYIEIDSLDFLTKYALVITNFIIIIVLLVYNKFFKKPEESNPSNERHNILIVIAKPSDITKYL